MRGLLAIFFLLYSIVAHGQDYYLFAGTYTKAGKKHTGSAGIYVYRFNDSSGKLQWLSNTPKGSVTNPSYLVVRPDGKYVYACTDTRFIKEGSVSAFSFNDSNGTLRFINKQLSGGANPVYVALHNSGRWLVNGNYTGGSVSVYPVSSDGSLVPARQIIQHYGKSANEERQEKAHVHATVFSPDNNYLFVPDLGADKIMGYAFNEHSDTPMQPAHIPYVATVAGSGPRHMVFHPNGRYAYCVEELGGSVTAYSYHDGVLIAMQRIGTYKAIEQHYNSADVHISPDGRFLYATNRGLENNIAIFAVEAGNGKLTKAGHAETGGEEARNFIITPSGKYLLVANQLSGNIIVFKRDQQTGLLTNTGIEVKLPEPSCLQLLRIK